MDKIQIKDLDSETPVAEDYLVFQKATGGNEVYKAPKSEIEGHDAYVYIAYASDDSGTDFTNTFDPALNYIAILSTDTEILSPVVGDFAGLWKNYKGEKGDTGLTGAYIYRTVGIPDNSVGLDGDWAFDTSSNSYVYYKTAGAWELVNSNKGAKGDTGVGIVSVVKTGTVGLVDTYTITYDDASTSTFDVTNGEKGDQGDPGISFIWLGEYSAITAYDINDVVSYNGSSYICILASTGNLPTNATYFELLAAKGADGEGSGDMLASVYDPTNIGGDAFDYTNFYNTPFIPGSLDDLSDVVITTPQVDQVLKYNGTAFVNSNETTVNGGAGVELYYVEAASDISGYSQLLRTPDTGGELDETVVANNNRVLINEYATPSTGLGGTKIDAGTWTFDIWAYVDVSLAGSSSIEIDIFKRTVGGTETLLFTVNSGSLMTALGTEPNVVTTVQPEFSIDPTDRIVAKVYGKNTASNDRTIHFFHGGTAHYSHINSPLVVRHNDLAGINEGDIKHVTAAQLAVIANTSGTNTGDQDLSGYQTIANLDTAVNGLGYLKELAFADLTDYPADAAGVLTNDGLGNLSWEAGGGSKETLDISATATPAIDADLYDYVKIAVDRDITSMSSGLSGTLVNGQKLNIEFTYDQSDFSFIATSNGTVASMTLTINKPTGTQEGDFMLSVVKLGGDSSAGDLVTPPSGWTFIGTQGSAPKVYWYYKVAGASEPASYNWVFNDTLAIGGICSTYRGNGLNKENPIMAALYAPYGTADSNIKCGSVTPTAYNTIAIASGFLYNSGSTTAPSGWTMSNSGGIFSGHKLITSLDPTGDVYFVSNNNDNEKWCYNILLNVKRSVTWGASFDEVGDGLPVNIYPQKPTSVNFEYNSTTSKFETTGQNKNIEFDSGVSSWDLASTAVTAIPHFLGRIPKKVKLKTSFISGTGIGIIIDGLYITKLNRNSLCGLYITEGSSTAQADVIISSSSYAVYAATSTSVYNYGVVSVDKDFIYITPTKTGSPTGNASIMWEVE